jgi:hypothetical protein
MSIRSLVGDSVVDLINLSLLLGASFIARRNKHKYPLGVYIDVDMKFRI